MIRSASLMAFCELFPTQLVGSWVKPQWLADHDKVYGKEGTWWRLEGERLSEGLDDAVRLAVADQERAGLTYVTDGEQRRQTFSGHFYRLGGIDSEQLGEFTNFENDITAYLKMRSKASGVDQAKLAEPPKMPKVMFPRVVDALSWKEPIVENELAFLKRTTSRRTKVTVIGPITLSYRLVDEHYGDHEAMVMGLADALNAELKVLDAAGVDLIQIDEPELHFRFSQCREFAVEAIDRVLHGLEAKTACHICYGYAKNIAGKERTPAYPKALALAAESQVDTIVVEYEQPGHDPDLLAGLGNKDLVLGVLSLAPDSEVETVEHIVRRVSAATEVVAPERLSLGPDCGMWFLPRPFAWAKIRSMALAGAALRNRFER